MVVCAGSLSTQEAEARESWVGGQPQLLRETLSQPPFSTLPHNLFVLETMGLTTSGATEKKHPESTLVIQPPGKKKG
jgi:hypothetical protein